MEWNCLKSFTKFLYAVQWNTDFADLYTQKILISEESQACEQSRKKKKGGRGGKKH